MSESGESNITTIGLCERPTETAHILVRECVKPGDRVVDATIGNGHDTVFLADLVGPSGHVDGFDIQDEALESARLKLLDPLCDHVTLHSVGHEKIADLVEPQVQAVMFNLGHLPGGDKRLITQAETTIAALQAAAGILSSGGIVTIVVYTGHPGGQKEAESVTKFCCSLDDSQFSTTVYKSSSDKPTAPFLITITRQ